ncbi:hypothetical protein GCM10011490_28490 [Pseudoclavibacter endophyticus]|uniref:DUF4190 domain-containing protein n=1 Tax=Pseudoclavibacter endophyticus TaxID=1778590 RepID=A0A6H9WNB4_9MICO|nr:DUF4190 domain-containing protein [Pseudoclavibacter endophyticus]KAB1646735.1 DUF4190 domain-containing protein [Pseudoclavibacter endophyticus]GGA75997.1 hypothetical protein GCM10011490_28490 [Pseudoclavibacter endophyticus]
MNTIESNDAAARIAGSTAGTPAAHLPQPAGQWPPSPTPEQERAWRYTQSHAHGAGTQPDAAPSASAATYGGAGASMPGGPRVTPRYSPASVQNLATWALVLGIVCVFFNPLAGFSIAAGTCAIVALVRHGDLLREGLDVPGKNMAVAGLVLAGAGILRTWGFGWFIF